MEPSAFEKISSIPQSGLAALVIPPRTIAKTSAVVILTMSFSITILLSFATLPAARLALLGSRTRQARRLSQARQVHAACAVAQHRIEINRAMIAVGEGEGQCAPDVAHDLTE